ncbi:hypothetical protein [Actinocrispum sp. NPDC049592]|uniref:hypothetical protein n=1 Tax=Actinocrispum sp. NPDC049592 TaxID=3154835 RepID=UPI0034315D43
MTVIERDRIGWRSWVWIGWRQHRAAILVTGGLITAIALFALLSGPDRPFGFVMDIYIVWWKPYLPVALSAVIGAFWVAPLVAREFDNRTHLVSWTQDATPRQWLRANLVVLAVPAVALTVALNVIERFMISDLPVRGFTAITFEANVFMAITYTLFAIALGVLFSALFRQSVFAVAATLATYVLVRILFATSIRPHLLPPARIATPWELPVRVFQDPPPDDVLWVGEGFLGDHGNEVTVPSGDMYECSLTSHTRELQAECLSRTGIRGHYVDYQPLDRMAVLQFLEILVYLALTAGLVWLALRRISRLKAL